MPLRPTPSGPVPEETARVARAVFKKGNRYLRLRDELGPIYTDEMFASLFPPRGRPAEAPWRLALVTVVQFAEGLSDRQAADAVRSRLDLKYLLGLELTDEGFDFSVLSEFRARLLEEGAAQILLDALLERCKAVGLLKPRGKQRTDSTHVLAAVRALNRLECVGEALRHALNTLALIAPEWLRTQVAAAWFARYDRRFESERLPQEPAARDALAATIGADGVRLLRAIDAGTATAWLRQVPAVATLRGSGGRTAGARPRAAAQRQRARSLRAPCRGLGGDRRVAGPHGHRRDARHVPRARRHDRMFQCPGPQSLRLTTVPRTWSAQGALCGLVDGADARSADLDQALYRRLWALPQAQAA